jgi:hypothetical protein
VWGLGEASALLGIAGLVTIWAGLVWTFGVLIRFKINGPLRWVRRSQYPKAFRAMALAAGIAVLVLIYLAIIAATPWPRPTAEGDGAHAAMSAEGFQPARQPPS